MFQSPSSIARFDAACLAKRMDLRSGLSRVDRLERLSDKITGPDFFAMRDDVCRPDMGGTKIRALEYLLPKIVEPDTDTLICSGFAGSSHVAAVAHIASNLGFGCAAVIGTQPVSQGMLHNMQLCRDSGCRLVEAPEGAPLRSSGPIVQGLAEDLRSEGFKPSVLPFGGGHALASLSYARGVFEMVDSLRGHDLPLPDRIYVPQASGQLAAGLAIGVKLAGLPSRVMSVRITPHPMGSPEAVRARMQETLGYLPREGVEAPAADDIGPVLDLVEGTFNCGYAEPAKEGAEATKLFQTNENITLDSSYTAKAAARMLADAHSASPGENWLMWLSANGGETAYRPL